MCRYAVPTQFGVDACIDIDMVIKIRVMPLRSGKGSSREALSQKIGRFVERGGEAILPRATKRRGATGD